MLKPLASALEIEEEEAQHNDNNNEAVTEHSRQLISKLTTYLI
jgi:hypothetical protein